MVGGQVALARLWPLQQPIEACLQCDDITAHSSNRDEQCRAASLTTRTKLARSAAPSDKEVGILVADGQAPPGTG